MGAGSMEDQAPKARPLLTCAAIAASVVMFVGRAMAENPQADETYKRWGYRDAWQIWDGEVWGLLTSVFLHADFMHLVFNVFWLWRLGRAVERVLGNVRYLLFFVVAGWLTSVFQLAASDATGIGLSGVGYALFGFVWVAVPRFPSFRGLLDGFVVGAFLIWLVLGVVMTYRGDANIGNAAHISGLAFGILTGAAARPAWRRLAVAGLVVFAALGTVPLVWAPWSLGWTAWNATRAYERGEYEQAVEHAHKAIELAPDDPWAYWQRGWAYLDLERYDVAIDDFTRALDLDAGYYWALAGRGRALRLSGEFDGALADLAAAIESNDEFGLAHEERGWCHSAGGAFADAIRAFTRAIECDPTAPYAYGGRGEARRLSGDLDGALADLDAAIERKDDYAWAYTQRGYAKTAKKQYAAAIADFTQSIGLDATAAIAWTGRAEARERSGDAAGAAADRERAAQLE